LQSVWRRGLNRKDAKAAKDTNERYKIEEVAAAIVAAWGSS